MLFSELEVALLSEPKSTMADLGDPGELGDPCEFEATRSLPRPQRERRSRSLAPTAPRPHAVDIARVVARAERSSDERSGGGARERGCLLRMKFFSIQVMASSRGSGPPLAGAFRRCHR